MEFNEAKEKLKDGYLGSGFEIVDEHPHELFLKYRNQNYQIYKEDIEEYTSHEQLISSLEVAPEECGICGKNYREQMLQNLDRRTFPWWKKNGSYLFGNISESDLYVEIGEASMLFVNYFRLDKTYIQLSLERVLWKNAESEYLDIRKHLYMPLTIRVYNISEESTTAALKRSSAVIDACLFEISYLKNISIRLTDEWPIRERRLQGGKRFEYGKSFEGRQLPLPIAKFNSDIISFYQLGMSSDVLRFFNF